MLYRVDQNTNPTLAGVCPVQPVTATHALLPGPAAPRPGYASPSAVIMTANRLVIHGPGLLNTLDTVPLLMGRIGYAWQWAQVRWVQHTRRYTHIQAVFGLSVADFLISMEHQPLTIKLCNCIPKQTSQNSRYLHIHCLWVMESES